MLLLLLKKTEVSRVNRRGQTNRENKEREPRLVVMDNNETNLASSTVVLGGVDIHGEGVGVDYWV